MKFITGFETRQIITLILFFLSLVFDSTALRKPVDIKNAPDGFDKINMTELAAWVNGQTDVQPTPARQNSRTSPPTTSTLLQNIPVNLWESRRRVPAGLAVVYGSDWEMINSNGTEISDEVNFLTDEDHLKSVLSVVGGLLLLLILIALAVRLFIMAQSHSDKNNSEKKTVSKQEIWPSQ